MGSEVRILTVREALELYAREAGPKYASRVQRWIEWGGRPEDELLARYVRHLREEGLSDATVDLHLRTIRAFYRRFGVRPPAVRGWRFDARESRRPALDRELIRELVGAARGGRVFVWHVPLLVLATVYGMRAAEMAAVRPEDVDLTNSRIYVRTLKGGVRRWVWLPPELHLLLEGWEAPSAAEVERAFADIWSAVADEPKPRGVGWHAIRRALVRDLAEAGVPSDARIRFLRWRDAGSGANRMDALYSAPNLLVSRGGVEAVTGGDQGARDYDGLVWDRHPYLPMWR